MKRFAMYTAAVLILSASILMSSASILILSASISHAKEAPRKSSFGIFAHFNYNLHSSDFQKLPDVPNCCPQFSDAAGIGISAGLLYEIPITSMLFADLRAGFYMKNAGFVYEETEIVNIDGTAVEGIFEHTLDTQLGYVGFEPTLGIRIWSGLAANIGLLAGFPVLKKYDQIETLKKPDDAVFENGTKTRLASTGDIMQTTPVNLFLVGRLSWEFPLNKTRTVWLAPEIAFDYGLTPVVENYTWNITTMRGGLALKFSPSYEIKMLLSPKNNNLEITRYTLCDNSKIYYSDPDSLTLNIEASSEVGFEKIDYWLKYDELALHYKSLESKNPQFITWEIGDHLKPQLFDIDDTLTYVVKLWDAVGQYQEDSSNIIVSSIQAKLLSDVQLFASQDEKILNVLAEDLISSGKKATNYIPDYSTFRMQSEYLGGLDKWELAVSDNTHRLFDTTGTGTPPSEIGISFSRLLKDLPTGYNDNVYYYFEITDKQGNICTSEKKKFKVNRESFQFDVSYRTFGIFEQDSTFVTQENPTIELEDRISTRLQPLLNYVFFEDNSAALPDRYRRLTPEQTANFRIDQLHDSFIIDTYHHILNIIGRRLQKFPNAKITITGCNSDLGDEKGNTGLSKQRADIVHDYLKNIWKVSDDRMTMESRNLPEQPSSMKKNIPQDYQDGIAENRRVEITSDTYEIIQPILTYGHRYKLKPKRIFLTPKLKSDSPITKADISLSSDNSTLASFDLTNSGDTLYWDADTYKTQLSAMKDNKLITKLFAENKKGQRAESTNEIPVIKLAKSEGEGKDTTYDEYSLVLFDFASDKIGANNLKIIDIIKERVNPGAIVTIVGHTDRVGDDRYNMNISSRRATSTEKSLNFSRQEQKVSSRGAGETELLYNNGLPEGRFYCRTVNISVINPVRKEQKETESEE